MNSTRLTELPAVIHLSTERNFRGGERQVVWLHRALIAQDVSSHVVCRKGSDLARRLSHEVFPVTWRGLWDVGGQIAIERICRRLAPAIIHCHDSHAFSAGMLAGSRTGTPVVYTRRVAFPIRNTWLNRRRYGRCGHIMAVSRAVADECRRIAPETPVTVVHDGVRWSGASLDRDELRGRLGMKDDTFAIGSVGFFTGEKNSQLLGVLAESLLTTRPAAQLVVVGPLSAADKKRFDGLTNVTVVGPVPVATEYYSTFDMYVSTSTSEGLGSALIDAIVRDIPVVALDSGGVRDIVRDAARVAADEGDFVSAVKNAITDYDEAKREALALGTQIRDDFTIDHMVEKTRVVYEDVITRKAGAQHVGDVSTPGE